MQADIITDERCSITVIDPADGLAAVEDAASNNIEISEDVVLIVKLAGVLAVGGDTVTTAAINITATTAIGSHRVITMQGQYADCTNPDHGSSIAGISLQAVVDGDVVQAQPGGEIYESGWDWIVGQPVYLGTLGQLTQTPPVAGILVEIGRPITATRLLVDIQPTIYLT